MATTAKPANYTAEQTALMVEAYKAEPTKETVEKLAKELGKNVRSIVAKLSRENVYKKQEYTTKTGEKSVSKNELADQIGAALGMNESDIDSIAKANKSALKIIFQAISEKA
jgi:arsenate reductase-like glutaredoxin family protein